MSTLEVEVRVRAKNQLTLPEAIAKRLSIEPGDRLVFAVHDDDPDRIEVRRLRRSYAGILAGVYGATQEEVDAYLREERASWGE